MSKTAAAAELSMRPSERLPIYLADGDLSPIGFMRLGALIAYLTDRRTSRADRDAVVMAAMQAIVARTSTDHYNYEQLVALAKG